MKIKEVSKKLSVPENTVRNWCRGNNVRRVQGIRGMMEWDMSEADIKAFQEHRIRTGGKVGRPFSKS